MKYIARLACLGWIVLLTACQDTTPPDQHTLTFSRIVDLSHVITQDMPHLPSEPPTQIARADEHAIAEAIRIGVHSGTHISTPAAQPDVHTVDRLSPRELVVPVVVLDVRDRAQDNPYYVLSVSEVRAWERQHGRIPAGSMVLLATGWDMRWVNPAEYLNLDARQVPLVPGVGAAAKAFLLEERQVRGLGIDTPRIAGNGEPDETGSQRLVLRNLTNLEQLPPTGATLIIGIVKIQAGAGSPASVLAFVP